MRGNRGLPAGLTLRKLFREYLRRPYRVKCPDVTEQQIVKWIERHYRETGDWPVRHSGPVRGGYPDDTWMKLDSALWKGSRSLPGGSSLAQLRWIHFGVSQSTMMTINTNKRWNKPRNRRKPPKDGSW